MQNQENRKKTVDHPRSRAGHPRGGCRTLPDIRNQKGEPGWERIVLEEGAEDWDGEMKDMSEGQTGIKIPGMERSQSRQEKRHGRSPWRIRRRIHVISNIRLRLTTVRTRSMNQI